MEIRSLTALMRARETLDRITVSFDSLEELRPEPDELLATGMLCSDLISMIDELFAEFEILFPQEFSELGLPPEPPERIGIDLDQISEYFGECREYLLRLGSSVPIDCHFEPEITDQELWSL